MSRPDYLDLVWLAALLFWLGLSCYFAWVGNAGMFQRLGAFGVASQAIFFALVERNRNPRAPIDYHEQLHLLQSCVNENHKGTFVALSNTAVLATHEKLKLERRGDEVPEAINHLAAPLSFAKEADEVLCEMDERPKISGELSNCAIDADKSAKGERDQSKVKEIYWAALGTFQWGFGDMPVNRFLACGEWTC